MNLEGRAPLTCPKAGVGHEHLCVISERSPVITFDARPASLSENAAYSLLQMHEQKNCLLI